MDRLLKWRGGLERGDIHWTNAVLCDGQENDLATARRCCAQRLQTELAEIADANPDAAVLAVGSFAMQSACGLSRKPSILKYRGTVIGHNDPLRQDDKGIDSSARLTVIPTVHPAFVLRAPLWQPVFEVDVDRACRVAQNGFAPPERRDGEIRIVRSIEDLERWLPLLGPQIVIDIETTGLDIHTVRITCFVVADEKLAIVIPWSRTQQGEGLFFNGQTDRARELVNAALKDRVVVTHNGPQYDHIGLERYGIEICKWEDTLLGYHAITSHFPKSLGHVVACYEDVPPWKQWSHCNSLEKLWHYCGRDGLYNARAATKLFASMDADDRRIYEHDKGNAVICKTMSQNGFRFDAARAASISAKLQERAAEVRKECEKLTGIRDFNPLSPIQLREAFFRRLGARVLFTNEKSQAPSLGKDALRAYAASGDEKLSTLALKTMEYRSLRKCDATYVTGARPHADGRIHGIWLPYGTISGRPSCQKPNLANLPKPQNDPSRDLGGIRSLYIASEGRRLVSFDIKQAEFRIAAYMSGDPNMIAVCESGQDIHWMNACTIFGLSGIYDPTNKIHKGARDLAKNAVFAVCYLAEAATVYNNTVANGGKTTFEQIEMMLHKMQRTFAGYYEVQAERLNRCIRLGYVETPILGRKRWLGHTPKPTEAANFPIQGGASDAMNLKLQQIERLRVERGIDAMLVAYVYDAGYWDCVGADVADMENLIAEVFAEPVTIEDRSFLLPIDAHTGERWSEL
jgi:DNA polymerase I-like protein with 3'-5' exonuclease and polymerase domains